MISLWLGIPAENSLVLSFHTLNQTWVTKNWRRATVLFPAILWSLVTVINYNQHTCTRTCTHKREYLELQPVATAWCFDRWCCPITFFFFNAVSLLLLLHVTWCCYYLFFFLFPHLLLPSLSSCLFSSVFCLPVKKWNGWMPFNF